MTDQVVLAEIRSLKSDMGSLGDRLVRLRYEDFKAAFTEEMRQAVGEEGRRSFHSEVSGLKDSSACEHKRQCMQALSDAVEEAASAFMRDDLPAAREILDRTEGLICGSESPCLDDSCSRSAAETVRRVRAILLVYEGLANRFDENRSIPAFPAVMKGDRDLDPEEVESILDPLANAWRVRALLVLRRGERSLSELGKALDLKTGHLQFHLRALAAADLVALDRRRHLYSITGRGETALRCTEEMINRLGPPPQPKNGAVKKDMADPPC